jgi:hypothetical protein
MDITPYASSLRDELARAADVGDDTVKAAAQRLAAALESSLRLTLMEALSDAAAEITHALPAGAAVELRLQGREPVFAVSGDLHAPPADTSVEAEADEDGEGTARITFRLPESLKQRAEALAARRGQSLNSWLVHAARVAASGGREGGSSQSARDPSWVRPPGRHLRGWVK